MERTFQKPRWFDSLAEKLRPRKSFAHFSTTNNEISIMEINQIHIDSNPITRAEAERQQCTGLIYANISRFR